MDFPHSWKFIDIDITVRKHWRHGAFKLGICTFYIDCSHIKVQFKVYRLQSVSVCVYRLHAFPSALGFIPRSLSGFHFYGPELFLFSCLFFFRPNKTSDCLNFLWLTIQCSLYPASSFPSDSHLAAELVQSNPAISSSRNLMLITGRFCFQACSRLPVHVTRN